MTKIIVMALMVMGLTGQVHAEGGDAKPCAKDRETLCANKHGKDMMMCMKENKDKVSPACKEHMETMKEHMKEHMQEAKEACHDEVKKLCGDVKPGGGRIIKCMKENESKITNAECKAQMTKGHGKHEHGHAEDKNDKE